LRGNKAALRLLKLTLGLVVIYAAGRHVGSIWVDLKRRGELPRLDLGWFACSVLLYVVGLVVDGVWFGRILSRTDATVPYTTAIRAYIISHLGKYVPGKALVVLMRVALVVRAGAHTVTAAIATIYETLVMMAAGGFVAALGLGLGSSRPVALSAGPFGEINLAPGFLGLVLGLTFLLVTMPMIFPRLIRVASVPFARGHRAHFPTSLRLLAEGIGLSTFGWMFFGLSQVAAIQAIMPEGLPRSLWPVAIGSVALATVAGFVIPIAPGGLGVREWVLWTSLGVALDHDRAVLSSLMLRLAWIVGELASAALLLPFRSGRRESLPSVQPGEPVTPVGVSEAPSEHLRVGSTTAGLQGLS
jgi:uncharacterized membrane protein YbhN (UPF0104 family)